MNKKSYLTSVILVGGLFVGSLTMQAQDRTIKLTTSKAVGSEVTLLVNHTYAGVTVDWGDGEAVVYNTGSDPIREITGTVKGSTITITGNKLWSMLSCADCGVTDIDLTGARDFSSLYCQNNELTTLDLRGMTELVDLNCANNQITNFTFTAASNPERDLTSIETLNWSGNQLTGQFTVRANTLKYIDISDNNYTSGFTSQNKTLDYLDLSGNQFKTFNLSQNTVLTSFVGNDNALTSVTLAVAPTTIEQFVCDNNNLSSTLDFSKCTGLVDLSCAGNGLSTLNMPSNKKLDVLNIANNKFSFAVLPVSTYKPNHLAFMPQAPVDISGFDNVEEVDGVPYLPIQPWKERYSGLLNISSLRRIGVTSSSAGSNEVNEVHWYSVAKDGSVSELETGGTSADDTKDYYMRQYKYAFFTPQREVYARLHASTTYADLGLYIETSRISIGVDQATGVGTVTGDADGLQIVAARGELTLSAGKPVQVRVYSTDGKNVWNGTVSAATTVNLPAGIYIVNGKKVAL